MKLSCNKIILNENSDIDILYECAIVSSDRNTYERVKIQVHIQKRFPNLS